MSIIKSTKSGRAGIELTLYHLLTQGWYEPLRYNSFTGKNEQVTTKICPGPCPEGYKAKPNFLYISHDKNGIARMHLRLKIIGKSVNEWGIKPNYLYDFPVNTLADLDLVLNFWNASKLNKKRAFKDMIMKRSKAESNMWFSAPDPKEMHAYIENDINTLQEIKKKITVISGIPKSRM